MTMEQIVSAFLDMCNNSNAKLDTKATIVIHDVEYGIASVSYDSTGDEPKIVLELK
jgi:hypothetical protein